MELNKINLDAAFSNTVVPEGQMFLFLGYKDGDDKKEVVIRYKDSEGNYGNIASGNNKLNLSAIANTLQPGSDATADANIDENGNITFEFGIPEGEKGDKGDNAIAYENLNSLSDGMLVPVSGGFPVFIKTNKGNYYPVEKNSLIEIDGVYKVNPTPYLVYDNSNEFYGTWRIYFAGGVKGEKGDNALSISSPITETLEAGSRANVEADFNENGVVTFKFQIPQGERGLNALTISEVITNTLEPESDATVEANMDEEGNVTFQFGVPKGIQGEKGDKGDKTLISIGDNGNWFLDGVDTGKKATGQGSNAVLSPTPPSETYDGIIWIQIESEEDNQFVNFESIDVVFGESEPENAPDGTIFIQE